MCMIILICNILSAKLQNSTVILAICSKFFSTKGIFSAFIVIFGQTNKHDERGSSQPTIS